jgi:hypothetical protein
MTLNEFDETCAECGCPMTMPGFCSDECYNNFLKTGAK